jgi:uncharacterized protein
MKVHLREIPCHRSTDIGPAFIADALAGLAVRTALERPADDPDAGSAKAELDLYLEGQNVFARGTLRGHVAVACSRCLGPVELPIAEELAVTFMPRSDLPAEDPDLEVGEEEATLEDEDDGLFPYEGEVVDLAPLFREQLVLAVPYAPLCREDCKGLCLKCGNDLNQRECGCDRRVVDPRLAALKGLKV